MTTVTPFLMFEGPAEEAINLYVSLIPNSRIIEIKRWPKNNPNGPGHEGKVMLGRFELAGKEHRASDSKGHAFTFTPSMSLFIDCADEAEQERIYTNLLEGGQALMPLNNYGFSRKFGWVNDRFGVSWQINLP